MCSTLFSEAPHVFVSAVDREATALAAVHAGMRHVTYCHEDMSLTDLSGARSRLSDLPAAPTCPSLFLACTPSGARELAALTQWWSARTLAGAPPIVDCDATMSAEPEDHVARMLLSARVSQIRASLETTVSALMARETEIAALRTEIDDVHRMLGDYRGALSSMAATPHVVCMPGASCFQPLANDVRTFQFSYSVWGLSRVDLYFRHEISPDACGTVAVSLVGVEDSRRLGAWTLDYDRISTGWQALTVPVTLAVRNHYVQLSIEWRSLSGLPPVLCLSDEHTYALGQSPLWRDQTSLQLPAIRLWISVPGLAQAAPFHRAVA